MIFIMSRESLALGRETLRKAGGDKIKSNKLEVDGELKLTLKNFTALKKDKAWRDCLEMLRQ